MSKIGVTFTLIDKPYCVLSLTNLPCFMADATQSCPHFNPTQVRTSDEYVCQECVKTGDTWVHLRTCQTCGGVHCCDSSKNKHATQHFHRSGHPVVVSAEPGERWAWCYEDEMMMRYEPR